MSRLLLAVMLVTASGPSESGGEIDGGAGGDGGAIDGGPGADVPQTVDAGPDAANLAGFGEPCTNRDQCMSDICIFAGTTGVCSMLCKGTCPRGYGCYGVLGVIEPGVVSDVCVPESDLLCSSC